MNRITKYLFGSVALFSMSACNNSYVQPDAPIKEVPFTQVHLDDNFWTPRIETNRTVSIPSAFKECEKNGRFDNFAIAGGLMKGEHRGDFSFDDTDPYKIIEGASYSLAVKYDKALDAYLDSVITLIATAQEPDGYLTTCVTNKCYRLSGWWGKSRWEKINSHELYNSGHLYEAAVAHYRATGKRNLLDVAIKNADLVCEVFGPNEGQKHVPSGHPIAEMALAKLYKVTGDEKYLKMAKYFVEETGRGTDGHRLSEYSQDHKPILQQDEIVGHAVRAGYLYSGVADVASLTQDTAYFNALSRIWENMASKKLFITGGIGSRPQGEGFGPNYELNNHTAYCETCAAIANVYWNHRMFLATGNAKYADVLERALYNGVISGVSLSGDKFFYDNQLKIYKDARKNAMVLVDQNKGKYVEKDSNGGYHNYREIKCIDELIKNDITGKFIITPFKGQSEILKEKYDKNRCGTIHTFQGKGEKEVYLSATLNETKECINHLKGPYNLFEKELINVAVSRAKDKFVLAADTKFFKKYDENMKNLIEYIEIYGEQIPDKTVCIFDDLYKQIPTYKPTIKGIDNPYEEKTYKLIKQYVENDNRYKFTYKLPLAEFVTDKKFLKENPDLREFILRNSHLDFAIYTTSINKPIVAIEVDGGDHKKEKQKIRDAKKEKILEYMEIPLLRVPSKNTWTEQEFKEKIEEKIQQN